VLLNLPTESATIPNPKPQWITPANPPHLAGARLPLAFQAAVRHHGARPGRV